MGDAIRLSAEKFQQIYEASFRTWSRLYLHAIENPDLPASCLSAQDAFRQQTFFPGNLSLKHAKYAKYSQVLATGSSTWGSTDATCDHGLSSFQRRMEIEVAVKDPVSLSIAETARGDPDYVSWFASGDQNYLAVLVLAWAYILSARWSDVMPRSCSLRYTSDQAARRDSMASQQDNQSDINVDIGNAGLEEARWWAAVLAPGQGWQAIMDLEQDIFFSPWSIRLQPSPRFLLSRETNTSLPSFSPHSAASFSEASNYLDKFCVRHNIVDQSHAALSAVLLLPSVGAGQVLQLPTPGVSNRKRSRQQTPNQFERQSRHDWVHRDNHLDKLLALSCNARGVWSILLSAFYEPNIECNAVTPWIQGAMAVIESLANDRPHILGRMFMERVPDVAFLWVGSIVLGLQKELLRDARSGLLPIDLHSAVWSGAIQSFIQQPVSSPLVANGYVTRADECRLLFLSQSEYHTRVPICQWRPFGVTPFKHVDLEVRIHAECKGHRLRYLGFSWDCTNEALEFQSPDETDVHTRPSHSPTQCPSDAGQVPIFYGALDREKEDISENATRNIFGWLRFEGHTSHEKEIWEHEWFEVSDSDEEDERQSEANSSDGPKPPSHVESWVLGLE